MVGRAVGAQQVLQQPVAQVVEVGVALADVGIANLGHALAGIQQDALHRRLGGQAAVDGFADPLEPAAVLGEHAIGLEDLERFTRLGEIAPGDQVIELLGDNHEAIPAARTRTASGLPAAPRSRRAEIQGQIVAKQRGELARIVHLDGEFELVAVERDRQIDVGDDVSD